MKILVIGGSYFYGRVFVMEAVKSHEVTVVNRGTYSMESMGARQLTGDRKDAALWKEVQEDYDVIVDFCAYEAGDVESVLQNICGKIGQYILISTVDVYERGILGYKEEETAYESRQLPGEAGAYIAGKIALENELKRLCENSDMRYTILRPAILYGPYNYAPRESVFIQLMVQQRVLPQIVDATGDFQFLYVKDGANAIIKCMGNEAAYGEAFNLCGDEVSDYEALVNVLVKAEQGMKFENALPLQLLPMTAGQAEAKGLPLPFPVFEAETELYSNAKSKAALGMAYTSLAEGMEKTYRAFYNVYKKD